MTWETCGMSIPRPITSVATNRRNSPFRNRSKVFNLDSWSQCRRQATRCFFVTGKPNKKKEAHTKKTSFRDVGFHGGGSWEISWWFWSKRLVIRKQGFYGQISWPWGRRNLKTSHPEIHFFLLLESARNLWKRKIFSKASWNCNLMGFSRCMSQKTLVVVVEPLI